MSEETFKEVDKQVPEAGPAANNLMYHRPFPKLFAMIQRMIHRSSLVTSSNSPNAVRESALSDGGISATYLYKSTDPLARLGPKGILMRRDKPCRVRDDPAHRGAGAVP